MSASDKKRQRKAQQAEGLTQKQRFEAEAARKAKTKKTVYWIIGILCAVGAAALLIWNSLDGMAEKRHNADVAATVGGTDYSVVDLRYYYNQVRQETIYQDQLFQYYYGFSTGFDSSKSDGEQWYSESAGTTYADYFRQAALSRLQQVRALCDAAKEAGYTLSQESQDSIQSQLSQIDMYRAQSGLSRSAYLAQIYGSGITEKIFVQHLTNDALASEYQTYHEENIAYDETDIQDYYREHKDELDSFDYRSFSISGAAAVPTDENGDPLTDESGNTVSASEEEQAAAMAAAKELAQAAVAEIEAAEDRDAAFAEAAPKYVSESIRESYESDPDYSLSTNVSGSQISSATYYDWLKDSARKAGDVTYVETTSGYTVVLFLDRYQDTSFSSVDVRHILVAFEADETDESGNAVTSDAAKEAAKAEAQAILDEWKAGEATAESFGALAEEKSDDTRDDNGALYAAGGQYTKVTQGEMVETFNDWIFDPVRKSGDYGLVETSYGWHVMYFEQAHEPTWRNTIIENIQSAEQSQWMTDILEATPAEAADGLQYVGAVNTAAPTATPTPEQ